MSLTTCCRSGAIFLLLRSAGNSILRSSSTFSRHVITINQPSSDGETSQRRMGKGLHESELVYLYRSDNWVCNRDSMGALLPSSHIFPCMHWLLHGIGPDCCSSCEGCYSGSGKESNGSHSSGFPCKDRPDTPHLPKATQIFRFPFSYQVSKAEPDQRAASNLPCINALQRFSKPLLHFVHSLPEGKQPFGFLNILSLYVHYNSQCHSVQVIIQRFKGGVSHLTASNALLFRSLGMMIAAAFAIFVFGKDVFFTTLLVYSMLGSAFVYINVNLNTLLFKALPPGKQGGMLGVWSSLNGMALLAGALASGFISFYLGYSITFFAASILIMLSSIILDSYYGVTRGMMKEELLS